MAKFPPWEVYNGVLKQIEYSGGSIVDDKGKILHKKKSNSEFITTINADEYIEVKSINRKSIDCIYIIVKEDSQYSAKSAFIKSAISKHFPQSRDKKIIINFITPIKVGAVAETAINTLRIDRPNVRINNYPYVIFSMIIPDHYLVPKHILLSRDEAEKVLHESYMLNSHLPEIKSSDPMVVWTGGEEGDIYKVIAISETTCENISRCIVIK